MELRVIEKKMYEIGLCGVKVSSFYDGLC